jgi:hypothetical protein
VRGCVWLCGEGVRVCEREIEGEIYRVSSCVPECIFQVFALHKYIDFIALYYLSSLKFTIYLNYFCYLY